MNKTCTKESCISLILRLSFVALFGNAALSKFMMGLGASADHMITMFKATWLPEPLVSAYAFMLPWVEAIIAIWLLLGVRLKEAWCLAGLTLISLGFGLMVTQSPVSANIYIFILVACAGIYFSDFDDCKIFGCCKK